MSNNAKPHVAYGDPISLPKNNPKFYPWPKWPHGVPNVPGEEFSVELSSISQEAADAEKSSERLVFHAVGDTGNDSSDEAQVAIAKAMAFQVRHAGSPEDRPGFFYLLGDVVYPLGEDKHYRDRFYEPYKRYAPPIVSVPGNHDGYGSGNSPATSLDGWVKHFLGSLPKPEWSSYRPPQRLPFVFWELKTSVARIIGLYSNVDGHLDDPASQKTVQRDWLSARLKAAPKDVAIIVVVHHPPYSLDDSHGGSPAIVDALDSAVANTATNPAEQRWPDLVLSGHVHSAQRYTRRVANREIPYVVAGAGGRAHKRKRIAQFMEWDGELPIRPGFQTRPRDPKLNLQLVAADVSDPGFLTLEVTRDKILSTYWKVPFDDDQPVEWYDRFSLDLRKHTIDNH